MGYQTEQPIKITVTDESLQQQIDGLTSEMAESQKQSIYQETHKGVSVSSKKPFKPFITFIDDDGDEKFLTYIKPIFDAKAIKYCLAIIGNRVDTAGNMSSADLKTIQSQGNEILSHSHTHTGFNTSGFTPENIEYELKTSQDYLRSLGLYTRHFVYPGGQTGGTEGERLVKKYYQTGIITGNAGNTLQNANLKSETTLGRVGLDGATLDHLKAQVDYCLANNTWMIFMSHATGYDTLAEQQVISDLIDYIKSVNITIGTVSEALDIFGNPLSIGNVTRYLKLLGNNEVYSNFFGTVFKSTAEFNLRFDTKLEKFETDKITYTKIMISDGETQFPETNEGLLTTVNLGAYNSYQLWRSQINKNQWIRYWSGTPSAGSWGSFMPYENLIVKNGISPTAVLTDFEKGITLSQISNATGYPSIGQLVTINSKEAGYFKQILMPYNADDFYFRTLKTDGTYTTFEKLVKLIKKSIITPSTAFAANETKVLDIDISSVAGLSNQSGITATCRNSQIDSFSYNIRVSSSTVAKLRITNLTASAVTLLASDWDLYFTK